MDYTFDTDLANKWQCAGFAADPTVVHPSQLHPAVTFHNVAAKMLTPDTFQVTTTIPSLRKWLRHDRVDVLKMDCEGCEYSLARDIILEDPGFFDAITQFAVEVHTSKVWLNSDEGVYSLAMLLQLLQASGLTLQHAAIGGCAPSDEASGCMDALMSTGFPCGAGKSCHNYLFARM